MTTVVYRRMKDSLAKEGSLLPELKSTNGVSVAFAVMRFQTITNTHVLIGMLVIVLNCISKQSTMKWKEFQVWEGRDLWQDSEKDEDNLRIMGAFKNEK